MLIKAGNTIINTDNIIAIYKDTNNYYAYIKIGDRIESKSLGASFDAKEFFDNYLKYEFVTNSRGNECALDKNKVNNFDNITYTNDGSYEKHNTPVTFPDLARILDLYIKGEIEIIRDHHNIMGFAYVDKGVKNEK